MSDLMSILSTSYASVQTPSPGKYVPVDAGLYVGSWKGAYADGTKFSFDVQRVNGFRAQVKYQAGSTVKYQQVLIKDNSFRIGNSKFLMTAENKATIKTVISDPVTGGANLNTAFAKRE